MSRQSIGFVEFTDLRYETRAQMTITRFSDDKTTGLFLDLDVDGKGVMGAGDCEIGLDDENTRRLLVLLQKATSIPSKPPLPWQPIGEAEFCWSDHTETETAADSGVVLIESNGVEGRMTFQTKTHRWWSYVATFSLDVVHELTGLLKLSLSEPEKSH